MEKFVSRETDPDFGRLKGEDYAPVKFASRLRGGVVSSQFRTNLTVLWLSAGKVAGGEWVLMSSAQWRRIFGMGSCRNSIPILIVTLISVQILLISRSLRHTRLSPRDYEAKPGSEGVTLVPINNADNYSHAMVRHNVAIVSWPTTLFDSHAETDNLENIRGFAAFWKSADREIRDFVSFLKRHHNLSNGVEKSLLVSLEHKDFLSSVVALDLYGWRQVWPVNAHLCRAVIFDDGVISGYSRCSPRVSERVLIIPKGCRSSFQSNLTKLAGDESFLSQKIPHFKYV